MELGELSLLFVFLHNPNFSVSDQRKSKLINGKEKDLRIYDRGETYSLHSTFIVLIFFAMLMQC